MCLLDVILVLSMGFFGKKKANSFLGVDIGASSIKIVEFGVKKGRATLLTYGYAESPSIEASETMFDDPKATGKLLARVCKDAGCKSTSAMAALPSSNVFSTILSIPEVKDKKQRQAVVDTEVGKLTPLPLSEMITQTTFLDDVKTDSKKEKGKGVEQQPQEKSKAFRALVTGSAKTFIQKYLEIFKVAGLDLKAIDTESLALVRALVGKDKGAIMILDIGSKRTNILIVEKGVPFVSRSVGIGGNTVTQQIMKSTAVSEDEAERMKRDLGVAAAGGAGAGGLPPVLEPIMQPLVNEIRYAFQLYAGMELAQMKTVEKIIVTGGSAHLPHIPEFLAQTLDMNVYRGDPWARVLYPADLGAVLEEIGPRMSVAIGLAMREID